MSEQQGAVPLENRNCPGLDGSGSCRQSGKRGGGRQERYWGRREGVPFVAGRGTGSGGNDWRTVVCRPGAARARGAIAVLKVAAFAVGSRTSRTLAGGARKTLPTCRRAEQEAEQD